jgi:CheY-like chemotaxis protein
MSRVLVVDDDRDILGLVSVRLTQAGHRVLGADSGPTALRLVAEHGAPEVAVLDVDMPGMSGLELLQRLRADHGLVDMPAIFLSARVAPRDIEAGRALGALYLTKPFVATALLRAIEATQTPVAQGW